MMIDIGCLNAFTTNHITYISSEELCEDFRKGLPVLVSQNNIMPSAVDLHNFRVRNPCLDLVGFFHRNDLVVGTLRDDTACKHPKSSVVEKARPTWTTRT